jgi:hypothetical protein
LLPLLLRKIFIHHYYQRTKSRAAQTTLCSSTVLAGWCVLLDIFFVCAVYLICVWQYTVL